MQRLTVAEYARRTGKNESTVRKWINTGFLKTSTEVINNRKVTVILVDDSQGNIQDDTGLISSGSTGSIQDDPKQPTEAYYGDFVQKMYDDNMNLVQDLKNYAQDIKTYVELAGQAKLLTVSEENTRQRYFEVQQENKTLLTENGSLKSEVDLLKKQLEELKVEMKDLKVQLSQAIQVEVDSKIKDITIKELEKTLSDLNVKYENLQFQQQNNALEIQKQPETKESWLSKL